MMAVFLHNLLKVLLVIGGVGAMLLIIVPLCLKSCERFGWKIAVVGWLALYALALAAGLTFL